MTKPRSKNGRFTFGQQRPVNERFWDKVKVDPSGCWLWTGARNNHGYGVFGVGSLQDGTRRNILAHRFAYEIKVGPVPEGMELNHKCRNTRCVNPDHLEVVTHEGNMEAELKAECRHGHLYAPENTYVYPDGSRRCRICKREQDARYKRNRRLNGHSD